MTYLYIKNGQGFFTNNGDKATGQTIDKISKNDILIILHALLENEDFQMDEYDENTLKNPAHKIIYKNIYERFMALIQKRVAFQDEKVSLYKAAIEKYGAELEE